MMPCAEQPDVEPSALPGLAGKVAAVERQLLANAPLLVAYSGGVDSAFLLAIARQLLDQRVLAVIADSPSLPRKALEDARALTHQIGARLEVIQTRELDNADYSSNPVNRCYFCKAELFTQLSEIARQRKFRAIAYGENADDMRQIRPGRRAAEEFAVIAPLRDCGLTKAEIRELSRRLGLPTADQPAQPCLSSRIPHGTPVTIAALQMIEHGEALVRELGFKVFRVRHIVDGSEAPRARVQIAPGELDQLKTHQVEVRDALLKIGYAGVEIDPNGYRSPA